MKLQNALVLIFALLLVGQLFIRANFREPYPMIVLPAGAGVYEHETDTITTSQRVATAYAGEDSIEVPESTLFPESPVQYHRGMYFSLSRADTSSEQWANAAQWINRNIVTSTSLTEVDSLCIHRAQEKIPIGKGNSKVSHERSLCYNLSRSR